MVKPSTFPSKLEVLPLNSGRGKVVTKKKHLVTLWLGVAGRLLGLCGLLLLAVLELPLLVVADALLLVELLLSGGVLLPGSLPLLTLLLADDNLLLVLLLLLVAVAGLPGIVGLLGCVLGVIPPVSISVKLVLIQWQVHLLLLVLWLLLAFARVVLLSSSVLSLL